MDTNNGVLRIFNQLAKAHRWIPDTLKFKPFEASLNRLFTAELDNGELNFLEHKVVNIYCDDIALDFSVSAINQRIRVTSAAANYDASMRADSIDFLLLIYNKVDPDTLFFRRKLRVDGSTELGLSLKNFLDTIEVDQKLPTPIFRLGDKLACYIQQQKDGIIAPS